MLYMNDINTLGMICQCDISNIRWVTVQARGRVAELLDELRQTVGAQGIPGWGSCTQYVYGYIFIR